MPRGVYVRTGVLRRKVDTNAGQRWATRNPEKKRAQWLVSTWVKAGKLQRRSCEICGIKAHAHHDDYSKPLEVRWLCPKHHKQLHVKKICAKCGRDKSPMKNGEWRCKPCFSAMVKAWRLLHHPPINRPARTTCGRGHALTEENSYWYKGRHRYCRQCRTINWKACMERKRP